MQTPLFIPEMIIICSNNLQTEIWIAIFIYTVLFPEIYVDTLAENAFDICVASSHAAMILTAKRLFRDIFNDGFK